MLYLKSFALLINTVVYSLFEFRVGTSFVLLADIKEVAKKLSKEVLSSHLDKFLDSAEYAVALGIVGVGYLLF
jgi:hypothetical protein